MRQTEVIYSRSHPVYSDRPGRKKRTRRARIIEPERVYVQGHLMLYFPGIAILIVSFAVAYCVAEILLHYTDNVLFAFQVGSIALLLSPLALFAAAKRARLVGTEFFGGMGDFLTPIFSCTGANLFINIIANLAHGLIGLQLQPAEIYLFYVAISVGEEATFRLTLVTIILAILVKSGSTNVKANAFVAACISGFLFMWLHVGVYGDDPIELASVFGSGWVFSWYFAMTGNPMTCLTAHIVNNMLAASFVFAGVYV